MSETMGNWISAIGTATPSRQVTQADAYEHAKAYLPSSRRLRSLKALYTRSTIESRATVLTSPVDPTDIFTSSRNGLENHLPLPLSTSDSGPSTGTRMLLYEQEIANLATQACLDLISSSSIDQDELIRSIESIVTVSCTGFSAPGFDIGLIGALGLDRTVHRHHIGFMGCHGAINGLRVANALSAMLKPSKRVLLCAAEICSIHFQYGETPDELLANCLFADGAASTLVTSGDDCEPHWQIRGFGSLLIPESEHLMSWKIRDNGFIMTLSPRVADIINERLRSWLTEWLSSFGLSLDSIQGWAVHPGGPKILDAVEEALGLHEEQLDFSRTTLRIHGNMSSPTVLFILQQIKETRGCIPTVILSFGPGLTIEAALLT